MGGIVLPIGLGLFFFSGGGADGVAAFTFTDIAGFDFDSLLCGVAATRASGGELVCSFDVKRRNVGESKLACTVGGATNSETTGAADGDGFVGRQSPVLRDGGGLKESRACGKGAGGRRADEGD